MARETNAVGYKKKALYAFVGGIMRTGMYLCSG